MMLSHVKLRLNCAWWAGTEHGTVMVWSKCRQHAGLILLGSIEVDRAGVVTGWRQPYCLLSLHGYGRLQPLTVVPSPMYTKHAHTVLHLLGTTKPPPHIWTVMHSLVSCQPLHSSPDITACVCAHLCNRVITCLLACVCTCVYIWVVRWCWVSRPSVQIPGSLPVAPCCELLRSGLEMVGGIPSWSFLGAAGRCLSLSPLISPLTWGLMPTSEPRAHPLSSSPRGSQPCQRGSEEESGGEQICQHQPMLPMHYYIYTQWLCIPHQLSSGL